MTSPDSATWTFPNQVLLDQLRDEIIDQGLAYGGAGWVWSISVCALDERDFHIEVKAEKVKGASE